MKTLQGRRIPVTDPTADPLTLVREPGDYYGPVMGFSGAAPAVFFIPPRSGGDEPRLHHVCSPPHQFFEQPDGSLSIKESIGCGPSACYYWHGYLEGGVWREC